MYTSVTDVEKVCIYIGNIPMYSSDYNSNNSNLLKIK